MGSSTRAGKSTTLAVVLTVGMLATMVMGVGPGLWLINPDEAGESAFGLWGLPKVYLWGLLWYAFQVGLVVIACLTVWRTDPNADETDTPVNSERQDACSH